MPIEPGEEAPDFELKDQGGNAVRLSSFRGDKAVALVFYPFTFTGVCEGELCALRDDVAQYEAAGVQLLALSCDSVPAQKVWAEQKGWTFPVLSDFWPHGEVARAYGVFDETRGCAIRATFLVGLDGTVVDAFSTDNLGTAREKSRYDEALAKL
ncbi:MAG: Peroxiredoxin [Acidimicrobiales bacterium]|nr:Peroxiredoxin [Acidimicrobiales bacterium]